MNAIELLKSQHQEVNEMFVKLEAADEKAAATRKMLFGRIADALAVHGEIEEKIFYPAVRAKQTEDLLLHSLEEHMEVKKLIANLIDMEPNDAGFDALCNELKNHVLHHVGEEENELFPKVEKLFDAAKLDQLGEEMDELATELKSADAPMKPREMAAMESKEPMPSLE